MTGIVNLIYEVLFLPVALWLIGAQVQLSELRLLTGRYNYKWQSPQAVTFVATLLGVGCMVFYLLTFSPFHFFTLFAFLLYYAAAEWLLSRWSPSRMSVSLCYRFIVLWITGVGYSCVPLAASLLRPNEMLADGLLSPMCWLLAGIYMRNCPFGVVHGKPLFLAYRLKRGTGVGDTSHLYDKEHISNNSGRRINVTEHGIVPDTGCDVLGKVQALIDEVGRQGGGTLYFPRGRYLFNKGGGRHFLQINYSHTTLEGECDTNGLVLTELVNCGTTVQGHRNPWLSPFFITTGEQLQPSNMFWGLDFRKGKGIRTESSSLSDPGSDGKILTPPFVTHVTADAKAGSTVLQVADSAAIGKYVLLGLYNTTPDGKLIKKLLGFNELRPEWTTALRAGEEEAPSFQWLVEVLRKVDERHIELSHALPVDCLMEYEPALFNVDMLEDIHLRHLRLNSRWNGLFRHHGFPLYYSVAQSQEMDYGWNALNMKRVAHSSVEHVEIRNFTNPLYVQDSCDVTVGHITIKGYDGHQGLKAYCHTCDCLFHDIDFYCHFADMMGGEGNAYGNVFRHVRYLNPTFKPVDYDFHGFSEGPMSPPAFNHFEQIDGFRYIKGAGAVYNQPACAVGNVWKDCIWEGGRRGEGLFLAESYRVKSGLYKYVTAVGFTVVMMIKKKNRSIGFARKVFAEKLESIDYMSIPRERHKMFFNGVRVE